MLSFFRVKTGKVLSALTLNDAAFWGADAFVAVVFALFITEYIGGSAVDVGLAFGLYRATRALLSIPVGQFLDQHKGHLDEYYTLMLSGAVTGFAYISMFYAFDMWHVYAGMILIGIGHTLNLSSWKILFYSNIPDGQEGSVIGVYETIMQVVYALAIIVAGFVGDTYGFQWTMFYAGLATITASIVLIIVRAQRKCM